MLTPQELREKTFEKAMFGGYDMAGVDDFLDQISGDYEALHKENAVLRSKMKVLVEKIEEYRATEDGMRRAILAAQKMSEEQLAETQKNCAAMLREAEDKAAQIIRDAQTEAAVEEARYLEAKKSSAQYIERMRLLCSKQLDFFDAMPEYDVAMYANKKQKTTPETAKQALEALLPVLSDEALDFANKDAIFEACKNKAAELGVKNGWLLFPLGIALSGKQRTPGGGTDLACMMGREKTVERIRAAIAKLG